MKHFEFINDASMKEFKSLPKEVQKQFGNDLNAVQQNKRPYSDFKNIGISVGKGAIELIENGSPAYRTVYCAKFNGVVYILHSFTKTTNGSDGKAMKTAKARYSLIANKHFKSEK